MIPAGARSGRSRWEIVTAALLMFSFVLNSCATNAGASSSPDAGDIVITVVDEKGTPLLHGVIVRVSNSAQSDGEDNGSFKIESCAVSQVVIAWAPSHQVGFTHCDGISKSYTVRLESLADVQDDPSYKWLSAASDCSSCHAGQFGAGYDEYHEWQASSHATVFDPNGYFESLYIPHTMTCAACHAPAALQPDESTADLTSLFSSADNSLNEGITCDVCHKVNGIYLENNLYPYLIKPGILSFQLIRSDSFRTGPFSNIVVPNPWQLATIPSMCSKIFSKSEFCAACHYGGIGETLVYSSYKEWKESPFGNDPSSNNYRTCQDCHMSHRQEDSGSRLPGRSACSETDGSFQNFNHNMMDYGLDEKLQRFVPRMVRGAANVDATFEYQPQQNHLRIFVTVENRTAGHNFPTDSPLRHLILVVDAQDQFSEQLLQVEGTQVPTLGGIRGLYSDPNQYKAYAGWPGKMFGNQALLENSTIPISVAYWNMFQLQPGLVNNSANAISVLRAGQKDFSTYTFEAPVDGEVKITISLIYRFGFYDLMHQKGWTATQDRYDIPVRVLEYLGNIAETKNFVSRQIEP